MAFRSSAWFYIYVPVVFMADISLATLFEQQIIYGLLSFYAYTLLGPIGKSQLGILLLLLCIEQFLIMGHFGLPLLYLLPATTMAFMLRRILYSHSFLPHLLIIYCLTVQLLVVEPHILHLFENKIYTIGKIFANILVMTLLSLKIQSTTS